MPTRPALGRLWEAPDVDGTPALPSAHRGRHRSSSAATELWWSSFRSALGLSGHTLAAELNRTIGAPRSNLVVSGDAERPSADRNDDHHSSVAADEDRWRPRCALGRAGVPSTSGASHSLPNAGLGGLPLGLSAKKGGKSSGFVITIILVFAYYSLSLIGSRWPRKTRFQSYSGLAGGLGLSGRRCGAAVPRESAHRTRAPPLLGTDENACGLRPTSPCLRKRPPAPTSGRSSVRACLPELPDCCWDDYVLKDFFPILGLIVASFWFSCGVYSL